MFSEILISVIVIFLVIGAWLDFFKAVGKLIWAFRIPITVAAIIYFFELISSKIG